jgi:hypothetical protein
MKEAREGRRMGGTAGGLVEVNAEKKKRKEGRGRKDGGGETTSKERLCE